MKDAIVLVAVSLAIGFALGGLQASAPPAPVPEPPAPPLPRPGVYTVTETSGDATPQPYDWMLSGCGPRCLRVHSPATEGAWQLDLAWDSGADRHKGAWVGERVSPGMQCKAGALAEKTGPVAFKYVIRRDLTGFVNMKFSEDNPSCWGETVMRGQELTLKRAKPVWS
ncbi:hypothetical protein A5731_04515 [Mycolicibacterium conceptionense]|uniref:Uncharacterized protein n=2 Tax=Mycolicibacterium TaxID=1866885 RepID=A0A1A0PBU1_9MYCO|nr:MULTISPECIES: hypothetical protein [Mycolicibacterium]MCW1821463.1 hypothetical protein [Mycolicibacterium senegalense]OBB07167.1 hypothetical protein A5718_18280 [Mycolicibacterium conceptionense]OBF08548.1 hypothetical protein A5731_04515 [Mycolicibacterium conceptionense]OBF23926.1 hypothetical protein A5726_10635 [Mycolicibacterium conceptionense]OBF32022.1 hypothetical protein A5720_27440 [Mycolicibacterium conceptionense]